MSELAEILWASTKSQNNKMLKISAFYLDKQKNLFLKKICGMLVFETLKNKISDFLNSNTSFCLRLYCIWYIHYTAQTTVFHFVLPKLNRSTIYSELLNCTVFTAQNPLCISCSGSNRNTVIYIWAYRKNGNYTGLATPARTNFISGIKSRVIKLIFLTLKWW